VIFGVYRFMSMAISACNTIGNSVASVVVAKWSRTFDPKIAERHLLPRHGGPTPRSMTAICCPRT
jgi:aerobic C4-dicarboxylate transport protein